MEREEQPRAVAGDAVRRPRAAVGDRGEPRESTIDELARRAPSRVGDEADAACVSLDGRVVQWLAHEGRTAYGVEKEGVSRRGVGC
jgi:hypothetical protein